MVVGSTDFTVARQTNLTGARSMLRARVERMVERVKETDLFQPVREFFEHSGYTVYSEVQFGWGGSRADIVATHGTVLAVVELKTSLSLDLIEQAVRWRDYAHAVYIGIPKRKHSIHGYVQQLLRREGIGTLEVAWTKDWAGERWDVTCYNRPRLNRKISERLWQDLNEHNLAANHIQGGSRGGGYTTDYKRTIEKLRNVIRGDWCTVAEILERVNYDVHWAAPKQSMAKALQSFESDWCECQKINGKLMFRRRASAGA